MRQCPYQDTACAPYLANTRELSPGLASRIEEHYCHGTFRVCSRYCAAGRNELMRAPNLTPWASVSARQA